jgi:diketogulonate reductase-like aldo/keto reductase
LGSTGSPLFQEKEIQEVAKKHDVSPGTVLLSYHSKLQPQLLSLFLYSPRA